MTANNRSSQTVLQTGKIILPLWLIFFAGIVTGGDDDEVVQARQIIIRMDATVLTILDPINVHVAYENRDSKAWTLFQPDVSVTARIDSTPVQEDASWQLRGGTGFYLGRLASHTMTLENGAKITEVSAPDLREITIQPNGRHEFEVALSKNRDGSFTPGPQIVLLKDEHQKIQSNPIRIYIVLTRRGVDRLLVRVKNTSLEQSERNWPTYWLEYIHPEPRLYMNYARSEGEERRKMETERQRLIVQYEEFWRKDRDTPAMRKILEEINVANGVPAEMVRQLEERDDKAAKDASDQKSAGAGKPQEPIPVSSIPVPELPQVASRPASEAVPSSASSRPLWPMAAFFTAVAAAAVFLVRLRSSRRPA